MLDGQLSGPVCAARGGSCPSSDEFCTPEPNAECLQLLQKQQALLGQMLVEGYGCERDAAAGKEWSDKARRRGYRMAGVYCEL